MSGHDPKFEVRLASDARDLEAAQRLRYDVFVRELGADGSLVDHTSGLERDAFDPFFDHLLLLDHNRAPEGDPASVVGVYRVLRDDQARTMGRFYSDDEYDLNPLRKSGRRLMELGRSCLHAEYRGGAAMFHLWQGLSDYIETHGIEILFGVASFHGTDPAPLAHPLSNLHHRHLAPEDLRVRAQGEHVQSMDLLPPDKIDRKAALLATPALIKAYLRLGGVVGEGAWVDAAFNTTDVCLIMDTAALNERQRQIYARGKVEA
ncbi:MAG: GNAT family N-acetyltransferase [Marinovum sp.]|nr:GNAT family N-acetyltransferase [Marinovum sp.]